MQEKTTSQTAKTAAAARAAHLLVDDEPFVFVDDLAEEILGAEAGPLLDYHRQSGAHPVLAMARMQVVCRSRYTENRVMASKARQYVLLGAGLDTFAYRHPGVRDVYELDHPATQEWKRERLTEAGIEPVVTFVPLDFETDSIIDGLTRSGFDLGRPAVVSWLGVTMYLTSQAIGQVLDELSRLAPGTELVLDHMLPAELRDELGQFYVEQVAPTAAEWGEPWLSLLSPDDMAELLREHGFTVVEQVTQADIVDRPRTDVLKPAMLSVITTAGVG
ncbi:class I SAM-dependent methyltransferase [Labedaea rhizosphaerae]|uniref:S-adenosyl-L-methionine-dependent methyltransferase n=1 Tax=Labedaea rhizosphaerae TaxID=598644 RepID=A0A4V3D0A8_LABRH|nr:class I SAM-dependent methyltransferase [Labedaea rhizosphaerae]TDQ05025.1 methyltransferase (TIGR00027 family) [Labedaea rhizosphaerae]